MNLSELAMQDAVQDAVQDAKEKEYIKDAVSDAIGPEPLPEQDNGYISFNFDWLLTRTGEGSIDDYINHPMNFDESKEVAQVLRGVTGFVDNLALAIIDIGIGLYRLRKRG